MNAFRIFKPNILAMNQARKIPGFHAPLRSHTESLPLTRATLLMRNRMQKRFLEKRPIASSVQPSRVLLVSSPEIYLKLHALSSGCLHSLSPTFSFANLSHHVGEHISNNRLDARSNANASSRTLASAPTAVPPWVATSIPSISSSISML